MLVGRSTFFVFLVSPLSQEFFPAVLTFEQSFYCPPPFLDVPLNWTATASGLMNNGGWQITNNGQTLRFNVEESDDGFCGDFNPNEQSGTATATFTLSEAAELTATVWGVGEPFEAGNEVMNVTLTNPTLGTSQIIGQGQNTQIAVDPSCAIVVTPACCASVPIDTTVLVPTVLEPGTYTITIDFSTFDGAYHVNAYFQTDLVFIPV